jgi:hypothetical protein
MTISYPIIYSLTVKISMFLLMWLGWTLLPIFILIRVWDYSDAIWVDKSIISCVISISWSIITYNLQKKS